MTTILTPTEILGAATKCLLDGGYSEVSFDKELPWTRYQCRLFEDPYSIVGLVVFDTWQELRSGWPDAQAGLVEQMSNSLSHTEAKTWEGYLALFTPALLPDEELSVAQSIKYDTNRLRKLLATGNELPGITGVRNTLLPLLPLVRPQAIEHTATVLDSLPDLLATYGIDPFASRRLISAFLDHQPLLEALGKDTAP